MSMQVFRIYATASKRRFTGEAVGNGQSGSSSLAQLKRRRAHVEPLHHLMRSGRDEALAVRLALDWLQSCPDLLADPEAELIDRILHSPSRDGLKTVGSLQRGAIADDERRRNWDAVQIFVDIGCASARLSGTVERELLWNLRARGRRLRNDEGTPLKLSAEQLVWIIASFRPSWPYRGYPLGSSWGDQNPWHATEYLNGLIARLGEGHFRRRDASPRSPSRHAGGRLHRSHQDRARRTAPQTRRTGLRPAEARRYQGDRRSRSADDGGATYRP